MAKQVTLTIDGQQVTVAEGTLIVDAAKLIGIDIPVFCYHPKMEPVGMCRMCLVEIGRPTRDRATGEWLRNPDGSLQVQFGPKLETACTTPVQEGMVVLGASEKAQAGREDIIEFLLTSHPLDCPICDKGGECPLQNLTMGYGPGESRFIYDEKIKFAKHYPLGDLIFLDRERCIQCARCVRFQDEVVGEPVIGFYHRGRALEIVTFSEPGFDSYFSGNTTDICPVGALTTADFRFGARPWELNAAASICTQCPVGCNLTLNVRREAKSGGRMVVKRVMPRQHEAVNEIWICDKGRFAYHFTESEQRLTQPLVRKNGELNPVDWDTALNLVAEKFKSAGADLLTLAGGRLTNEDFFNLNQLTTGLGGQTALYTHMAGGDLVGKLGVGEGSNFADLGPETAIMVVASDLQEEAPVWWLRVKQAADRGAKLIVLSARENKLDRYASQVVRYPYGREAATVLALVASLSSKHPQTTVQTGQQAPGEELQSAARLFAAAQNGIILFGSDGVGLSGSSALAQACAHLLQTTNHFGRENNGLIGVWARANEQGAWDMGFRPQVTLKEAMQAARALYIVAADPAGDDPALAESADFLVVQDLFMTPTAKLADVVLPVLSFAEREGTFTSGERRVQRFYPAVPDRPGPRADFTITGEIGRRLDLDLEHRIPAKVMLNIAAQAPGYQGLNYQVLSQVTLQWPLIGRADLYYGGTTYENSQGLGVQLPNAAQPGEIEAPGGQALPVEIEVPAGGLLAVPVTRLYDRGQTVLPSDVLAAHIPAPYAALNPADAARLKLEAEDTVQLGIHETETLAEVRLDPAVPTGVVLVPRSFGIPLAEPAAVVVRKVERVTA